MFLEQDYQQLKEKNITEAIVMEQIENFKSGFPKMQLIKPASLGDGITKLTNDELSVYEEVFEKNRKELTIKKFVPASGAATRMFKKLYQFLDTYQDTEEDYLNFLLNKGTETMFNFFHKLDHFAFYLDLKNMMIENGLDLEKMMEKNQFKQILAILLTKKGLNYGNLPKGLLKFHRYKYYTRTAFEEHIVEALNYAKNNSNDAHLHLSVSPDHKILFEERLQKTQAKFEGKYNGKLHITYSIQKPSTDTIAVDRNNKPFRNEDGSLLFRPGGHGALIENLNELNADIIFIKNIDNVVPDRLKAATYTYKKVLAGILLDTQHIIHEYLRLLESKEDISADKLQEMLEFMRNVLCTIPPENLNTNNTSEVRSYLYNKFNRPIRVCGMVENAGEPGGGPFWTRNNDNSLSLQIVEGSQIDKTDQSQKDILSHSTHFNPVDLVCAVKNYKNEKFDLLKYVDKQTGFISIKTINGSDIKAMELPGLWNGAMSDWNTIFVEVPLITFNPVKTIFDLLRIEHDNL